MHRTHYHRSPGRLSFSQHRCHLFIQACWSESARAPYSQRDVLTTKPNTQHNHKPRHNHTLQSPTAIYSTDPAPVHLSWTPYPLGAFLNILTVHSKDKSLANDATPTPFDLTGCWMHIQTKWIHNAESFIIMH